MPNRAPADTAGLAIGIAVVGFRATAAAVRLALVPARIAARTPPFRSAADRLALEGWMRRKRLGAAAGEVLAPPTLDALGRTLAEHRVVERVARPLVKGTDVEALLAEALESERTLKLVDQALESRFTGEVTDRVLRSPELERAVEEIAASAAVRAALARQTTSLADEVREGARRRAERLDGAAERRAHRWFSRPAPSDATAQYGGIATRAIALGADVAIVGAIVLVGAALLGLASSLVGELRPAWLVALILGAGWTLASATYFVVCWSTAGQTPGMRAMRLRVVDRRGAPPRPARSLLRLLGLALAIIPLFAGFIPVLFDERRRGLHDFIAGTVVVNDDAAPVATAEVGERVFA